MDKNVFIAILLSIIILIGYQFLVTQYAPPPKKEQEVSKVVEKPQESIAKPQEQTPNIALAIPQIYKNIEAKERNIKVENNLYSAIFTTKGGTLKSITFKNYTDKNGKHITLVGDDTIPPFALGFDEGFQFANLNFNVKGSDITLTQAVPTASLMFEYISSDFSIIRTYTFSYDDYGIQLKDEIKGLNSYWITIGKDFGIHEKDDSVHFGPVILLDAKRIEFRDEELHKSGARSYKQGLKWIAQEDKYFFSSIVPKSPITDSKVWNNNGTALIALKMPGGDNQYFLYAGPKEYDRLKKYEVGLEHIVDFGFFSILAIPLFWLMKVFYNVVNNYGVAIIFLTIITRIPFIPIIHKSMKSMQKIQAIQPKLAEIRDKYKKDPKRMNQEIMLLYKKHKVNPFGGCLPILLQIPVFFALYKILSTSIELRNAPFMLWITDLSAKDPYYILPIIMGATMVLQQKITPSTMDPKQQKLMMLLPIVFTLLFLTFPSGLVLYWLVNNILGIIQQYYMNFKMSKAES